MVQRGDQENITDAMSRIYVWLRYSAARQLTWQRNYNTQPRILGEAQRRLTEQIAQVGDAIIIHMIGQSMLGLFNRAACGCSRRLFAHDSRP